MAPIPVQLDAYSTAYAEAAAGVDLSTFTAQQARELLSRPVDKSLLKPVIEETKLIPNPNNPGATIELTITRPVGTEETVLPPFVYLHGGGFTIGSKETYSLLRHELTVAAHAAVIFVNYSLSPEVRYPVALEECYAAVAWVANEENAASIRVNPAQLVVGGDSAGGNLTTAVAILAKQRGLDAIKFQVMYYPVTDDDFDTESYRQFAEGYFLTRKAMVWFFDQYIDNASDRQNITVSPLKASIEDLKGLPPAILYTAEADPLRDEGEAYARKLTQAGVDVVALRILGTLHGFMTYPNWISSNRLVLDQTVATLRARVWN